MIRFSNAISGFRNVLWHTNYGMGLFEMLQFYLHDNATMEKFTFISVACCADTSA